MLRYLLGGVFCLGAIGVVKVYRNYDERCKLEERDREKYPSYRET